MPDTTAPVHDAKAIVAEALDTIKATFWVQGDEFNFAYGDYNSITGGYSFDDWDAVEKAIMVDAHDEAIMGESAINPSTNKAKVVGVCSIGALALANVTLYDEPLKSWDLLVDRDFETWKAGAAVAMAIHTNEPDWFSSESIGSSIASWNDATDRTREEIIAAFERALESPLLAAKHPVWLTKENSWGATIIIRVYFADEAAAQAFLDGDSPLRQRLREIYEDGPFVIAPVEHDSLETSVAAS
jgi:hypothetical protein